MALAVALRRGKALVARRGEGGHLPGLWEFPGGKVRPGEDPAQAARRELLEETGLEAGDLEPLVMLVHDYADLPLRFHVYLAHAPAGEVSVDGDREWGWKSAAEMAQLPMPEANRAILRALAWRLRGVQ